MSETRTPPDLEDDEFVPEDDQIIGQAVRWSLVALGVIGLGVAAFFVLSGEDEVPEEVIEKDVGAIEDLVTDEKVLPTVRFTDVTVAAGIDYRHDSGARGEKLLPETMGGGAAFLDYDGDGDQDLFFVNGGPLISSDEVPIGNRLYANDGAGNFTDVTEGSGLRGSGPCMGVAVADYDGDGRVDVFTTGVGASALYRNTPDGFVDVTAEAGVGGPEDQWSTSAGFFDYDGDDDLDLFVCNYVRWSHEIDTQLAFTLNGSDRAYGPPTNYRGTFSRLYRNDGDGGFTEVSEEAGLHVTNPATGAPMGKALGVSFVDFDRDGWTDIAVANDTVQNHLFHNLGDGTFEEIGGPSGLGFDGGGQATGAMGIDVADYRNDGGLGVAIGNFANEMSSLFVTGDVPLVFSDDAMGEGIGSPSRKCLSFGLFFFDYDLDGRQDLLQVNGHLEESINEVQPSQEYLQPPQLFWNSGPDARSCFVEVPPESAGDLAGTLAGRGSAYADIDGDGDLDVLLVQVGDRPVLLRNDQELGHRWLRVELVGPGKNVDGVGAWIEATVDGVLVRRQVTATRSYLSQSELPVTFGLGEDGTLESLAVVWPNGRRQEVPVPTELERTLTIEFDG